MSPSFIPSFNKSGATTPGWGYLMDNSIVCWEFHFPNNNRQTPFLSHQSTLVYYMTLRIGRQNLNFFMRIWRSTHKKRPFLYTIFRPFFKNPHDHYVNPWKPLCNGVCQVHVIVPVSLTILQNSHDHYMNPWKLLCNGGPNHEPAPTSTPSTGCPSLLSCGWTSTELIFGFTLVTNSIKK